MSNSRESAVREGRRLVLEHLGIESPSVDALVEIARDTLGEARLSQCRAP
jgi:hypothetical protein